MEQISRRKFMQKSAIAGVSITIGSLPNQGFAAAPSAVVSTSSAVQPTALSHTWSGGAGQPRARVEGLAKVTGAKIYARDFRAKDIPGWPATSQSVFVLRATRVDRTIEGFDWSSLPRHLKPKRIITAADLARDRIQLPWFYPEPLLTVFKGAADYYGQAVALLFYDSHKLYQEALLLLLNSESFITYGKAEPAKDRGTYGDTRFVRYAPQNEELYSTVKDGPISPPWSQPDAKGSANARGMFFAQTIDQELKTADWKVFSESYSTQITDPMFMEAESGLAFFHLGKKRLELVMGTQSPHDDAEFSAILFSDSKCPYKLKDVVVHPTYPGGGFGGRDHSLFSMYLALAAVYAEGRPVRMIQSRVEQFQSGIKRHATEIKETLAVDGQGRFQALVSDITMNGGGQNNFSFAVAAVGAHNAPSAYYFPRAHVHSIAQKTKSVVSGSMRGFGTLQSMFALESLIDEAAVTLGMDPLELRRLNIMSSEHAMITGAKPAGKVRTAEILEQMARHPLWLNRKTQKSAKPGHLYGVGAALALKTFGTAIGDAVMATVSLAPNGEIAIISNGIDMGNGSATSFSVAVARYLGAHAHHIKMGATHEFDQLSMQGSLPKDQAELDRNAQNPRWSPIVSMATAASTSAFNQMHVLLESAKLIFTHGLCLAAKDIWGAAAKDLTPDAMLWKDGQLTAPGLRPLSREELAATAHKKALVVSVCAHAYFMGMWAAADYEILGETVRVPLDGLAVQYGQARSFALLTRNKVEFPPIVNNHRKGVQTYTPCGALVAVEVNPENGETRVVEVQQFLDAGPIIVRKNVEGQSQGGIAMAIGHALYEELPALEGGPGQGQWNLDRYRVVRADDVPLAKQELHLLEPLSPDEPAKGIAEIVMIPVLPAITNAIAAATGKRFRSLPVTAEKIKGALHG